METRVSLKYFGNDILVIYFAKSNKWHIKWWQVEKSFQLTKEKFYELVDVLSSYISPRGPSTNFKALDAGKKLAVCLYYLKDTGSIWMTAKTFGIHQ